MSSHNITLQMRKRESDGLGYLQKAHSYYDVALGSCKFRAYSKLISSSIFSMLFHTPGSQIDSDDYSHFFNPSFWSVLCCRQDLPFRALSTGSSISHPTQFSITQRCQKRSHRRHWWGQVAKLTRKDSMTHTKDDQADPYTHTHPRNTQGDKHTYTTNMHTHTHIDA